MMELRDGVLVRTQAIHDHVFPLVAKHSSGSERMAGTAFIVGVNAYALTAAHCLPGPEETLAGMFLLVERRNESVVGRWAVEPIAAFEAHPAHDIALLKLTTPAQPCAFLRLSPRPRGTETEYQSWGYPERGYDYINVPEVGRPVPLPNLIYNKGYVRRTVSRPDVFKPRGSAFFEVSEVSGAGCSGSPIVEYNLEDRLAKSPKYAVIGVYIGEHTVGGVLHHDRDDNGALILRNGVPQSEQRIGGVSIGVVARAADFGTWQPQLLGHSLIDESNPTLDQAAASGLSPIV